MNAPDRMKEHLDGIVVEAVRREGRRCDLAGIEGVERVKRLADVGKALRAWRDAAPAAVLRDAPGQGGRV